MIHTRLKHNLFGQTKTVMAHGIFLEEDERELVKKMDLMLAHCPDSNTNVRAGSCRSGLIQ